MQMSFSGALFYILVFPGFLFLLFYGLALNFLDRYWFARLQNRVGPPVLQPVADIVKLFAKEDITPRHASAGIFNVVPAVAFAAVTTTFLFIPIYNSPMLQKLYFSFDLLAVIYLLTLPTVMLFLGGYYSVSLYSTIGAVRVLTQLFSYEIPLCTAFLSPAIIAGSWSILDIVKFYEANPAYISFNVVGFVVAIIALQGKLERTPFDLPEAETEIVGGALTEYSGKKLAMFKLVFFFEMVVGSSLIAALFMGGFGVTKYVPLISFLLFLVKTLAVVFVLSVIRAAFARIRIDQMVDFGWHYLVPMSLIQMLAAIIIKGWWM